MRPKKETIMAGCTREREFVRGRTLQKVNSPVITDILRYPIDSVVRKNKLSNE